MHPVFIEGEDYSLMERRTILDWQVKPRLRTVPGLIEVNSFGGHVKQHQALADPERLRAHGLTLADLREALEKNNRNAGGAYIPRRRRRSRACCAASGAARASASRRQQGCQCCKSASAATNSPAPASTSPTCRISSRRRLAGSRSVWLWKATGGST
jgi:hypothetical protein